MKRQFLLVAGLAAALIVPRQSATAAKPVSNITDLGTLGGQFSDAFGINNNSDPASVPPASVTNVCRAMGQPWAYPDSSRPEKKRRSSCLAMPVIRGSNGLNDRDLPGHAGMMARSWPSRGFSRMKEHLRALTGG